MLMQSEMIIHACEPYTPSLFLIGLTLPSCAPPRSRWCALMARVKGSCGLPE